MTFRDALVRTANLVRQLQQCAALQELETETMSELAGLEQQVRSLIDTDFSAWLLQHSRQQRQLARREAQGSSPVLTDVDPPSDDALG